MPLAVIDMVFLYASLCSIFEVYGFFQLLHFVFCIQCQTDFSRLYQIRLVFVIGVVEYDFFIGVSQRSIIHFLGIGAGICFFKRCKTLLTVVAEADFIILFHACFVVFLYFGNVVKLLFCWGRWGRNVLIIL